MSALRSVSMTIATLGLAAGACAETPPPNRSAPGSHGPDSADIRYRVTATVIDDVERGPVLCVGGVATSLPPQCGGMPLVGWDWDTVDGEDTASGQRWGDYTVIGTYDGTAFTVLEASSPEPPPREDPIDWTPCPDPAGGWTASDPSRTGDGDLVDAMRAAEGEDDFAGFWIDDGGGVDGVTIVNAAFTEDPATREAMLADIWGGPLCLVEFEHTYAELRRAQRELSDEEVASELGIETTWSGVTMRENHLEQGVIIATDEARAAVAERYGGGAVELVPAMVPVDEP